MLSGANLHAEGAFPLNLFKHGSVSTDPWHLGHLRDRYNELIKPKTIWVQNGFATPLLAILNDVLIYHGTKKTNLHTRLCCDSVAFLCGVPIGEGLVVIEGERLYLGVPFRSTKGGENTSFIICDKCTFNVSLQVSNCYIM